MPEPYIAVHHPNVKPIDVGDPQDVHTFEVLDWLEATDALCNLLGRQRALRLLDQAGDALR